MRIFAIFGVIIFCLIVWYAVAVTWKMPFHNYQLWKLQKSFRSIMQSTHPAPSKLRGEVAEFGNFGNSNHCDYLAGEFRSSTLSKEQLTQAYAGMTILSFDKISRLPVEVYFTDEGFFKDDYLWSRWRSKYLPDQQDVSGENTYLVFASSDMHPPDGDIRCH
jgi:hypothetical protein